MSKLVTLERFDGSGIIVNPDHVVCLLAGNLGVTLLYITGPAPSPVHVKGSPEDVARELNRGD